MEAAFWCPVSELESKCEAQERLTRLVLLLIPYYSVVPDVEFPYGGAVYSSEHGAALALETWVSRGMAFSLFSA